MTPPPQPALVTDSTAYLPEQLAAELAVEVISLYVTVGEDSERESEISDYGDFYSRLRSSDSGATTSQPSVGDFISVWGPLLDEGGDIVSIHLSAAISGTIGAAHQARRQLSEEGRGGERVEIVDSRSACGGMAFSVIAAGRALAAGATAKDAAARALAAREELKMWFAVDTLEYLRRGGRIGGASAWIGMALKIKPILTFEEEVTPVERVRTSGRAYERLLSYARQRHESGADAWIVQHIQDPETAERMVGDCREIFGTEPLFTSEIGAVIGAHAGPGLLGVGSVPDSVLGPAVG